MILKFLIVLVCMELWRLGGSKKAGWSGYRDVLIPIILGGYIIFRGHPWLGLLSIGSFNIIRMGYGIPDPATADEGSFLARLCYDIGIRKSWIVRGIAGALYGLIGGFFTISLIASWYFLYGAINFGINAIGEYKKWNVKIVERLAGLGVALFVFFF